MYDAFIIQHNCVIHTFYEYLKISPSFMYCLATCISCILSVSPGQSRRREVPDYEERKAHEAESSPKLGNEGEGVIDQLLGLLDDLVVGVDQEESHTVGRDGDHIADHLVLVELARRQTLDKRVESRYSQDS